MKCQDNSFFQYDSIKWFNNSDSLFEGDTSNFKLFISFDTTQKPYYYQKLEFQVKNDSLKGYEDTLKRNLFIFITPWRFIEVFDNADFYSLKRVWKISDNINRIRTTYFPQSTVPSSDISNQIDIPDSIPIVYIKYDDLPYSIPKLQSDSFGWDTNSVLNKASIYKDYKMRITNLRIFTNVERDNLGGGIARIFLKNATVDVLVNQWPNQKIIELKTDNEGFVVDKTTGSRDFTFTCRGRKNRTSFQTSLLVKLRDPDNEEKLHVHKNNSIWKTYRYETEDVLVSANTTTAQLIELGNASLISGQRLIEVASEHMNLTYTWIGWARDAINQSLSPYSRSLPNTLRIEFLDKETSFYTTTNNKIHIDIDALEKEVTHYHEFGHFVMEYMYGSFEKAGGRHKSDINNKNSCQSMSEGLAESIAYIVDAMLHNLDGESFM